LRGPRGYEYRSQATLFGLPLIHVAGGRDPATGQRRVAKGVIAIGDLAVGGLAIGGCSLGIISIGGCAFGLFSLGGLAVGMLVAFGGLGIGGLALGGIAIGILAVGGGAIGWYAACGGGATAVKYAVGGLAYAEHANDEAAQEFMESCLSWLGRAAREQSLWIVLVLGVCALIVVACIVRSGRARDPVES
jgi:hypothetical protein